MSLRLKLVLALVFAALLPMGVVVGVPMLQAERRARDETNRRLDLVGRQAALLIARRKDDSASRLGQVAADLGEGRTRGQALLQGPAAAARDLLDLLAGRYGLDHLECRGQSGAVLATTGPERGGTLPAEFGDSVWAEVRLARLPYPSEGAGGPLAFISSRAVAVGGEPLTLVGGVILGEPFVNGVAEIIGETVEMVTAGATVATPSGRVAVEVPLGGEAMSLRVTVPAGDVRAVRRELLAAFAGTAPFVLGSALLVGLVLAEGISRPIRALATRAEGISAERSFPLTPLRERDEVRRMTASFERMLDALAASERQRTAAERIAAWQEVARRVAHEVRNPLSPIRMAVENLRRTRARAPAEMDRTLDLETAVILEEVESLNRLVEEFSRFARLPAPQCEPCDLRQIVAQALALYAPRIESAGIEALVTGKDRPHVVRADPEQVGRAVKNIVANALDAMEGAPTRRLEIAMRSLPADPPAQPRDLEEVSVRDSGRGFDDDALRRVFEPYFTTRSERGGTGLGMAIVHRIATEHGGTVLAARAPGQGAVITLRMPVEGPVEQTS